jgi:RNA 2',3'-cyclic 3'-phosphodiesterase
LSQVEWLEEADLSVQLQKIENRDEGFILDIKEALNELDLPPFSLALQGINIHRSKGERGAFWLEVKANLALENLNKSLRRILKQLGVKSVSFPPHVLLGTFQTISPERLGAYLESHAAFSIEQIPVQTFALMGCRATAKRLIYTSLQSFPLRT